MIWETCEESIIRHTCTPYVRADFYVRACGTNTGARSPLLYYGTLIWGHMRGKHRVHEIVPATWAPTSACEFAERTRAPTRPVSVTIRGRIDMGSMQTELAHHQYTWWRCTLPARYLSLAAATDTTTSTTASSSNATTVAVAVSSYFLSSGRRRPVRRLRRGVRVPH